MKMIELFCGAGLMGAGFASAGFETIYAVDLDEDAIASYNKNLRHKVAKVSDVKDIPQGLKADIIVAGPPCQGFSTLGKRDKKDERNKLSLILLDWATSCEAQTVVIENVPQFVKSEYFNILNAEFEKLGYESTFWILNASDYNTPQHRKRSFTIFSKIGLPEKPKATKKQYTVEQAFKGLPTKADSTGMHSTSSPSKLALERIKNIPINGGKLELMQTHPQLCPESWFKLGRQAGDVWGRMDYNTPSNTIRCCFFNPSKGRYIHPTENRVITLREGARLQGVPDNWVFEGSRTAIARQIGNGVPIPLAKAVAKSVKEIFQQ